MNPQTWWYVARASGLVAWLMLTASVLWGAAHAMRLSTPRMRPAWVVDLHRWIGGLAVSFTAIHVGALVADSYVHFGVADVLVPFASSWKPSAVAWGVVSMWVIGAVEITSLLRRRLPHRAWWIVHVTSYGLFWTATIHGRSAGTDATNPLYLGGALVAIWATTAAAVVRVTGRRRRSRPTRGADRPAREPVAATPPG